MSPGLPKRPKVNLPANPLGPLKGIVGRSRERVGKAGAGIRALGDELRGLSLPERQTPPSALESQKLPSLLPTEASATLVPEDSASKGTACLPCSRDHFLTTSSSLSEGIRFAREKGIKDHEVMRRIRIALQELDIMERIDLAPEETTKLKGAEKQLADWALTHSRDLRHSITAIKDVETMEQAAARASQITEMFMDRLWEIPEEECETCGEIRESIRQFIEKRKRERGEM